MARLDRMLWPALALATVIVGGWGAKQAGWRVNITSSLPGVVYRVSEAPERGDFIRFCPPIVVAALPDSIGWEDSCDGKVPLIKRVVAVAGDRVIVDSLGVQVNGILLPNSQPKHAARDGTQLPSAAGEYVLEARQVWTAGEHEDSYDSRYFGPTTISALKT